MKCCQTVLAKNKDLCENILIQKDDIKIDEIYNFKPEPEHRQQVCIPFSRSEALCDVGESSVREQFNAITSFLDMSAIYGSDTKLARGLRTKAKDLKLKNGKWENLGTLAEGREKWNLPTR